MRKRTIERKQRRLTKELEQLTDRREITKQLQEGLHRELLSPYVIKQMLREAEQTNWQIIEELKEMNENDTIKRQEEEGHRK